MAALMASVSLMAMRGGVIRAARAEATSSPPPARLAWAPSPTDNPRPASPTAFTATSRPTSTATPLPTPVNTDTPLPPEPTPTASATATPESQPLTQYQVQEGDYLLGVAERHGVELEALLALNPDMNARSLLYVGQTIQVPTSHQEAAPLPPATPTVVPDTPTAEPEPTATLTPTAVLYLSNEPGCYRIVNHSSGWASVTLSSLQVAWRETIDLEQEGEWQYCLLPGPYSYTIAVAGEESTRTGTFDIWGGEDQEWPIY